EDAVPNSNVNAVSAPSDDPVDVQCQTVDAQSTDTFIPKFDQAIGGSAEGGGLHDAIDEATTFYEAKDAKSRAKQTKPRRAKPQLFEWFMQAVLQVPRLLVRSFRTVVSFAERLIAGGKSSTRIENLLTQLSAWSEKNRWLRSAFRFAFAATVATAMAFFLFHW